jgi:hypothetical protein
MQSGENTMKNIAITFALTFAALTFNAQACEYPAQAEHWLPISSAPHDAAVEIVDISNSGPWYGLYRWKDTAWVRLNRGGPVVSDHDSLRPSECLFWRPYSGTVAAYVDPTAGAEYGIQYWCEVWKRPYDSKRNVCKGM